MLQTCPSFTVDVGQLRTCKNHGYFSYPARFTFFSFLSEWSNVISSGASSFKKLVWKPKAESIAGS